MKMRTICTWAGLTLLVQLPAVQGAGPGGIGTGSGVPVAPPGTACSPAYLVSPASLTLAKGAKSSFTVKLACRPATPVTITAKSLNPDLATVSPASVSLGDTLPKSFSVTGSATKTGTATIDLNGSPAYAANNISDVRITTTPPCTDPLSSKWEVPASCGFTPEGATLMVKKGLVNGNTFAPKDDRFSGSFTDNRIVGIRHLFHGGKDLYRITVDRPEGGGTPAAFDAALSRIPGSFTQTLDEKGNLVDIPKTCRINRVVSNSIPVSIRASAQGSICPLDAGKHYYFNIRVSGAQNCGVDGKECRILSFSNIP